MDNVEEKIKYILKKEISKPLSYEYAIKNALYSQKSQCLCYSNFHLLKFVISFVLIIGITSSFVFAKDIEIYIKSFFNNSTKAIDSAIENEYFQKENMDYMYDKDIGVKLDKLVLDDLNLLISFNFRSQNARIKLIHLENFSITTDNNKTVYRSIFKSEESLEDLPLYNSFQLIDNPEKLSETTFKEAILLGLRSEKEDFKKLYFNVKSFQVTYIDNEQEVIEGNWIFNVEITDEMKKSLNVIYNMSEDNEFIENCQATMTNTGMIIELQSKKIIPSNTIEEYGIPLLEYIYLTSKDNIYKNCWIEKGEKNMIIHFEDISNFIEKSDTLELHLDFFNTAIILKKK